MKIKYYLFYRKANFIDVHVETIVGICPERDNMLEQLQLLPVEKRNNEQANLSLIHELCALLDAKFPDSANVPHNQHIVYVTDRPEHDRRYGIDNSKICSELGYVPVEIFQSGLAKTLDWYLARPEFWQGDVSLFGTHPQVTSYIEVI